jgi:hypothetical protein
VDSVKVFLAFLNRIATCRVSEGGEIAKDFRKLTGVDEETVAGEDDQMLL